MKVFLISGIAADERLFCKIRFPDGFEQVYVKWQIPKENEGIEQYAKRLFQPFSNGEPFIVLGVSLGGIIAVEIAKQFMPLCTIIVSSVPSAENLPPYYKMAGKFKADYIFPPVLFKLASTLKHLLVQKSDEEKALMRKITWSGNNQFIKWGINKVLNWRNTTIPRPLFHIHGSRDEVFPIRFTKPTHLIDHAGHTLILSESEKVNEILAHICAEL